MKKLFAAVLVVGIMALLFVPQVVLAQDPLENACNQPGAGGADSAVCQGRTINNPINVTLGNVIQIFILITGVAAVFTIIIGGFRYITSSGNPETTNAAKNAILFAIVGLIVALLAQILVTFVLRRL